MFFSSSWGGILFTVSVLNYSLEGTEDQAAVARGPLTTYAHEGAVGGRPVTKSIETLPVGVGVWTHPYCPWKKGFRLEWGLPEQTQMP